MRRVERPVEYLAEWQELVSELNNSQFADPEPVTLEYDQKVCLSVGCEGKRHIYVSFWGYDEDPSQILVFNADEVISLLLEKLKE